MIATMDIEPIRFEIERVRIVGVFTVVGAVSGIGGFFLTGAVDWLFGAIGIANDSINLLFYLPGLVFGVAVGLALHRRGLVGRWRYAGFAAGSAISYAAACKLALAMADGSHDLTTAVLSGGVLGGALQAALIAALFRFARHLPTYRLTVAAGMVPGVVFGHFGWPGLTMWIVMYALWLGCLAAGLAVAIPVRSGDAKRIRA